MGLRLNYFLSGAKQTTSVMPTSKRPFTVLGIETSCDDTGCAIVDDRGCILGESLQSQQEIHLEHGGIIPPVARDLHKAAIQEVVAKALDSANLKLNDVDAIATTLKPGLSLSLLIGMKYGKYLSKVYKKPFIPIHHMEAHALTVRMMEEVEFPFIVLLVSGGHSLLAVAQSATHFQLLGKNLDDAPGEVFDKALRQLKMRNITEFRSMSGGQAVEMAASRGNAKKYEFGIPMLQYKNCDFSFSGLKNALKRVIDAEEKKYDIIGGQTLPQPVLYDICASLQHCVATHICHRVQRALQYIALRKLIPEDRRTLVISGGVACNKYIQRAVGMLCRELDYDVKVPPPHLCTDNGIMIAWNGVERWRVGQGIYQHDQLDALDIEAKCPLGEDLTQDVAESAIKCKWVQWYDLLQAESVNKNVTTL
ncbi:tRNA N6-adenosine threonylcarbamoyltransferase, mitochondrial-like isoform X2 [Macrosteles quadrilineatus]|uniref:tRNA N6-adenosine threonylcarbamoyltransferase, mitochondrial-like isoform X2 n=1 Tax=Macrosteles quadrilineatus TaxID=74068 RepID=UPI0023E1D3E5|nr:tRNA N6-adenosine threonylcarbamoyltransferase, mitochondrial-like isoform X2 [Macrosteles quadrilineatus]XP_054258125.1 tRNA N6-adenosine threonylcarbamoyltransferase, mitochondrial-like isoform X2 [Macrosteles quadrilineatus]